MSAKTILEDIHYFLNTIIANASTSSEWDAESVARALKWAEHCENIYQHAGNGSQKMNAYVKEIANLIPDSVFLSIDLSYLEHAREHTILALIQNPKLPVSVYEQLLDTYVNLPDCPNAVENLDKISCVKNGLGQVVNVLKENNIIWRKLCSSLIVEYMWKNLSHHTSRRESEKWLSDYLQALESSDGIGYILTALCEQNCIDERAANILNLNVLFWLITHTDCDKPSYDPRLAGLLWSQPASLLCEVAVKHSLFSEHYIRWIVHRCSLLAEKFLHRRLEGALELNELTPHLKTLLLSSRAAEVKRILGLQPGIFLEDLVIMCST